MNCVKFDSLWLIDGENFTGMIEISSINLFRRTFLKIFNFQIQSNSWYHMKALQNLYRRLLSALIEILNQFWGKSSKIISWSHILRISIKAFLYPNIFHPFQQFPNHYQIGKQNRFLLPSACYQTIGQSSTELINITFTKLTKLK